MTRMTGFCNVKGEEGYAVSWGPILRDCIPFPPGTIYDTLEGRSRWGPYELYSKGKGENS